MSAIDYAIFGLYMCAVMAVGVFFYRRNASADDYYVGGRKIRSHHVGMSVVATDVGGGFSIGLGGLGFSMGLAGTWLLFTGLLGAWLSAVFVIPRLKALDEEHRMRTYPDFLRHRYSPAVAMVAALISGIGYMGFTGGQVLAGAKLASATVLTVAPWGLSPLDFSIITIAAVTVLYTVLGGLKAVIYTDTIQWTVLLAGLILVTLPVALWGELGGIDTLVRELPAGHFGLFNIDLVTLLNWMVTIVPIWLVAMTLYQRVFACGSTREAQRAWYLAGVLEWPVMAFMGVFLGMCARALYPDAEAEMGLPLLIRNVLPVGVTGIVIAAYFSAIMSTADSCLMASSGNLVGDVLQRLWTRELTLQQEMRLSQIATLLIGVVAILIASRFEQVLEAILFAYAFMVSGLFVPTLGGYFWPRGSARGAMLGMLGGGGLTVVLSAEWVALPGGLAAVGLDPVFYGLALSTLLYVVGSLLLPDQAATVTAEALR